MAKSYLKKQQRFKSDCHNVYTEQINKIALSSNDDKRLQTFYKITTYPYGTNAFKVCESEMRVTRILKIFVKIFVMVLRNDECNSFIIYKRPLPTGENLLDLE